MAFLCNCRATTFYLLFYLSPLTGYICFIYVPICGVFVGHLILDRIKSNLGDLI